MQIRQRLIEVMMENIGNEQETMPVWKAWLFLLVTGAFFAAAFFSALFGLMLLF